MPWSRKIFIVELTSRISSLIAFPASPYASSLSQRLKVSNLRAPKQNPSSNWLGMRGNSSYIRFFVKIFLDKCLCPPMVPTSTLAGTGAHAAPWWSHKNIWEQCPSFRASFAPESRLCGETSGLTSSRKPALDMAEQENSRLQQAGASSNDSVGKLGFEPCIVTYM